VLVGRAEMKIAGVATILVLTVGGALVEAAALPKPTSVLGGNKTAQFHHYVSKTTKYTSPEWGLRTASLRSAPVQIHPYVTGRSRF
jgi:hypothetical protein